MSKTTKRLFIAINLPFKVRQELVSIGKALQHPFIRWMPERNLHITLHFIGQTELSEIAPISEKISALASEIPSFAMAVEKLNLIKKSGNPIMVWAALEESEIFNGLVLRLQKSLPGDSSKGPKPHITLARIKKGKGREIPLLPELKKLPIEVRNIELMESDLSQADPVYKMIKSYELNG